MLNILHFVFLCISNCKKPTIMKLTRRNFFNGILGITYTTFLYSFGYNRKNLPAVGQTKVLPKALKKGATIGLIAPGYSFSPNTLKLAIKALKEMGYKSYHTKRIYKFHGYFSNTDEERAADINELFANENVDAILCIRAGYGCTRIMHLLDYDVRRRNPKALIGFSDVTALLNGIYKQTGLICFHGPVGKTIDDLFSKKGFKDILENKKPVYRISNAILPEDLKANTEYERYTINQGTASGELTGGSLTLINA
jgi:muramoyltetrapeptide carboxypeptidase